MQGAFCFFVVFCCCVVGGVFVCAAAISLRREYPIPPLRQKSSNLPSFKVQIISLGKHNFYYSLNLIASCNEPRGL